MTILNFNLDDLDVVFDFAHRGAESPGSHRFIDKQANALKTFFGAFQQELQRQAQLQATAAVASGTGSDERAGAQGEPPADQTPAPPPPAAYDPNTKAAEEKREARRERRNAEAAAKAAAKGTAIGGKESKSPTEGQQGAGIK